MISYEKEYQEIKRIIKKLAESAEAETVVVIDKNGQQIASHCKEGYVEDMEILDFLERTATVSNINKEIVRFKSNAVYTHSVNDRVRLAIIFSKNVSAQVSLLALGASDKLNLVFDSIISNLENAKDSDDFSNPSSNSSSSGSNSSPVFCYRYRN